MLALIFIKMGIKIVAKGICPIATTQNAPKNSGNTPILDPWRAACTEYSYGSEYDSASEQSCSRFHPLS